MKQLRYNEITESPMQEAAEIMAGKRIAKQYSSIDEFRFEMDAEISIDEFESKMNEEKSKDEFRSELDTESDNEMLDQK